MSGAVLLSEVIGALSYALDLTEGEPPGHSQRSCLIGMRLAHELGLDAEARSDLFYALLLKDAGCTANAARMAALFGADDHELKRSAKRVDWSRKLPAFAWSVRSVAPRESPRVKVERLLAIKDEGEVTRSLMQARCERGAEIARMIGLSDATAEAIRTLDEHWDGHGQARWHVVRPRAREGAARVPPRPRVLGVAVRARPDGVGARGPRADRRPRRPA